MKERKRFKMNEELGEVLLKKKKIDDCVEVFP